MSEKKEEVVNKLVPQVPHETSLIPSDGDWDKIKNISVVAFDSGLLPNTIKNARQAAVIALKGYELGLPPMLAFSHISVVNGKPCLGAELMLAHIYKEYPDADIRILESTDERCEISARRPNEEYATKIVWTIERARKMGFAEKDNWKKQPATMLRWRAITEMKRVKFPEILMGISYSPDEMRDFTDTPRAKNVQPYKPPENLRDVQTAETAKKDPEKTAEPAKNNPPPVDVDPRTEIWREIMEASASLEWSKPQIVAWAEAKIGRPLAHASAEQMKPLIQKMRKREL